ncbi:MAG: SagB/ThcOx family dehydrogenase [Proteobacteria bacterium]|nr:SagB/ThcOx family dehydrogenase [Pseudomonadota bacterium]
MKKLLPIIALSFVCLAGCQPVADCSCPNPSAPEVAPAAEGSCPSAPQAAPEPVQVTKTAIDSSAAEIALPKPLPAKATLTESLQKRRSIREYTDEMISLEQLSALLWSAYGVNREDGKRTAPTARNLQSVTLYVLFEKGAYKYDHAAHKLIRVAEDDLRPVKAAPVEILFTSTFEPELVRGVDAGVIAQNLALYCASEDLATVIRMQRGEPAELQAALKLDSKDLPILNMAVGFEQPKQ